MAPSDTASALGMTEANVKVSLHRPRTAMPSYEGAYVTLEDRGDARTREALGGVWPATCLARASRRSRSDRAVVDAQRQQAAAARAATDRVNREVVINRDRSSRRERMSVAHSEARTFVTCERATVGPATQ